MTEGISQNNRIANRMQIGAAVALLVGALSGMFLPNLTLVFDPQIQEAWQVLRPIWAVITQFSFPLAAALFVGAIIVRRMPDRTLDG